MSAAGDSHKDLDVVIVSPNTALDSYYVLDELDIGSVNRAHMVYHTAGGKGNNMARAVKALGGRVLSLGILGGYTGQWVASELEREGILSDPVWVETETRRSSTLVVPSRMETTVALDAGNPAGLAAGDLLKHKIQCHARRAPYLVLTGSLPPEFSQSYYAEIMRSVTNGQPVNICLDCSGEALQMAAGAGARLIKVNSKEFQESFGLEQNWTQKDAHKALAHLHTLGLQLLVITDGPQGAYVFSMQSPPFRVITQVDAWVTTAGAGDTFLAGLVLALQRGETVEAAACYGSAAAAANLQQFVCVCLLLPDVERFLSKTRIESIDEGRRG
jgi:1-phosphofructokinase family hexose kinase